jgi:hypothetical protein
MAVAIQRMLSSEYGPPVSSATWIRRLTACRRTQGALILLVLHFQLAEALAPCQRRESRLDLSFRMHSATLGQHSSRRNSARKRLPSMEVFWLAPIVELWRTTGAARATARISVWFHPSSLQALPASAAASVVPPAIRGDRCRGCRGQRAGSDERVPGNRRAGGIVGRHKAQSCSKASNDHTMSKRAQTGSFCGLRVYPNACCAAGHDDI